VLVRTEDKKTISLTLFIIKAMSLPGLLCHLVGLSSLETSSMRKLTACQGMAKAVADVNGEDQGGFASDGSNITGFSHMHDSGTGGVSLFVLYSSTSWR